MCRSRRELSYEYLLAKFGFDTAENEPCKVCPIPRGTAGTEDDLVVTHPIRLGLALSFSVFHYEVLRFSLDLVSEEQFQSRHAFVRC